MMRRMLAVKNAKQKGQSASLEQKRMRENSFV